LKFEETITFTPDGAAKSIFFGFSPYVEGDVSFAPNFSNTEFIGKVGMKINF